MNETIQQQRQPVLIVSHADGQLEAFADRGVDVHHARLPAAFSSEAEITAEDVMVGLLPPRFRELYRADFLLAITTTRPLLPSVLRDSLFVGDMLRTLDQIDNMAMPVDGAAEAAAAKLLRERRASA